MHVYRIAEPRHVTMEFIHTEWSKVECNDVGSGLASSPLVFKIDEYQWETA